jgi:ABC-type nickel/cobalt efflux system permease component RcnA
VEPVVVTATRLSAFNVSEMEMLVGSVIVIALLAWMVFSRVRRAHNHQPHQQRHA